MSMGFQYPVTLDLAGKRCLVAGEGGEAERKAAGLEAAGAVVRRTVSFSTGMLDGVFLAILVARPAEENRRAFAECETRGVLVNCLDDAGCCRFAFPSIHRQGDLTIAVSTNGACPALAVRIRETLGREYGPEYASLLEICRSLREGLKRAVPEFEKRRAFWYRLIDAPVLALLRGGCATEARELAESFLETAAKNEPRQA